VGNSKTLGQLHGTWAFENNRGAVIKSVVVNGKNDDGMYAWRTQVTNSRNAGPAYGPRFKKTCGVFVRKPRVTNSRNVGPAHKSSLKSLDGCIYGKREWQIVEILDTRIGPALRAWWGLCMESASGK